MTDQALTARETRDQAAEFLGFLSSDWIKAEGSGEMFEIPNRNCLDSEQRKRYNQLLVDFRDEAELLDRAPDAEVDGKVVKGTVLEPHTIDGKLVDDEDDRIAQAILGDRYESFLKGGGRSSDVSLIWWKMNVKLTQRRSEDSFRAAGDTGSDPVPDSN
jgi:hypothetical protein